MPYETITVKLVTPIIGAEMRDTRCVRHIAMRSSYSQFRVTVKRNISFRYRN